MTKLRTTAIAAAIAAAVAAPQARATEGAGDGEWNTQYGIIFSVPNVFRQSADPGVLGDFNGGVGLQYTLAPQRALRFSVNLGRESNPAGERETTNLVDGTTTKTFQLPGGAYTSAYDVNLGAMYMMRLSPSSFSPYLGVGGGLGYFQGARKYEDDLSSTTTVFAVDNMSRTFALNAAGTLGVEWRMHKSVSLFAEYGLGMALVTRTSDKNESSQVSKTTGQLNAGTKAEGSTTKFFNFDTGIGQGGQLGLVAFF
jgi:outer membrane protein W